MHKSVYQIMIVIISKDVQLRDWWQCYFTTYSLELVTFDVNSNFQKNTKRQNYSDWTRILKVFCNMSLHLFHIYTRSLLVPADYIRVCDRGLQALNFDPPFLFFLSPHSSNAEKISKPFIYTFSLTAVLCTHLSRIELIAI
jgi:hypothetical protein